VSAFVLTSAASPTYACTTIDTVQPAASGELGQVQPKGLGVELQREVGYSARLA